MVSNPFASPGNARVSSLQWLGIAVTVLQTVALACVTLLLISPTPFEHNSISLLVIQALPAALPSTSVVPANTSATLPNEISSAKLNMTEALPSVNASAQGPATSGNFSSSAPSHSLRRRQQDAGMPKSFELLPKNATLPNGATASAASATAQSDVLFRLGPLGSCFRLTKNDEKCSPAKLTGSEFDYSALQRAIDQAWTHSNRTSTNATTTSLPALSTSPTAFQVADVLPRKRNVYPTLILIIVAVCACLVAVNVANVVYMVRQAESDSATGSASWHVTVATSTKWATLSMTALVFVASGVEKYSLSNAKNAFNTAAPSASVPSSDTSSSAPAELVMVTLQADTGSAFGFAWSAAIVLLVAFWLQRTLVRRQQALHWAQSAAERQNISRRNSKARMRAAGIVSPQSLSLHEQELERIVNLPKYDNQTYAYDEDDAESGGHTGLAEKRRLQYLQSLPSLQQAHEGNVRLDAKESPPFSYYSRFMPPSHAHHPTTYPPTALHSPPQRSVTNSSLPPTSSRSYNHQRTMTSPGSIRSPSPAPSYWTSEVGSKMTLAEKQAERERERQLMARLRQQRSQTSLNV